MQEEKTPQKAAVGELERVYEYDILVSESMMEEGLSNLGDTINIRRAMHKLATGEWLADTKLLQLDSACCRCFSPLGCAATLKPTETCCTVSDVCAHLVLTADQ